MWQANLGHLSVCNGAAVNDAHQASADDGVDVRAHDRGHQTQQGLALHQRIGIYGAKERRAAHIQPGIQAVCLAAVCFGEH